MDINISKGKKIVSGRLVSKFQRHHMQLRRVAKHYMKEGDAIDYLYTKSLLELGDGIQGLQTASGRWLSGHAREILYNGYTIALDTMAERARYAANDRAAAGTGPKKARTANEQE